MQLRDTTQADILYLANHTASRGCFRNQPPKLDYVYTLMHENEILGIGGIKMISEGTAWAWIDASDKAKPFMVKGDIKVYKLIRDYMKVVVELTDIHRLQAAIEVDFPEAIRMVEHLGFERESIMKHWKGDKSAYMYVKFF